MILDTANSEWWLSLRTISLLTAFLGAINRHKTFEPRPRAPATFHPGNRPRSNVYVNPNYKPSSKPSSIASTPRPPPAKPTDLNEKRDVVIGGVAFESSGRSLVRKDCALLSCIRSWHIQVVISSMFVQWRNRSRRHRPPSLRCPIPHSPGRKQMPSSKRTRSTSQKAPAVDDRLTVT